MRIVSAMANAHEELRSELEKFRTLCFWWVHKDLSLIELSRETLLDGLRTYGGWAGMRLAAKL